MAQKIPVSHPGEILKEEFLDPMGITASKLAAEIGVDRRRTYELVKGQRDITADTALRLSIFLGTTAKFWLNLQSHYDLEFARDEKFDALNRAIKPYAFSRKSSETDYIN